jgi:flagellar basal body-associated protein FliL
MMNKKLVIILITVVLIMGLGIAGYFYWKSYKPAEVLTPEKAALEAAEKAAGAITKSAAKGTLPTINPLSNPLEEVPDVNPATRTNPFKGLKTNPFE